MPSPKKQSSFSWDRSGERQIHFKALKVGEKIGFGLGGDGHRQEVVFVKEGTQAYWKGVKKGYVVTSVNGVKVDAITVKSAIKEACSSMRKFNVGMSTGQPAPARAVKRASKTKSRQSYGTAKKKVAPQVAKKRAARDDSKEEDVQDFKDEKPIIDNGSFFYQEEVDLGEWFAGDDEVNEYQPVERRC